MSGEIPNRWSTITVGDACRLVNGRAFKPQDWTDAGLPIIRIQNLNNKKAPFNRFSGTVDPKFTVSDGELLFAWSGTPGTSFGAHIWTGGPAILNQHIFRVLDYEALFDKKFLRYALNDRLGELIGQAHGGAGLAHVTKPKLEATKLALPPLDEQRRIVAKLEALQARSRRAREALDAVPPLLEKLRQSILAAAFRGDLTKDWRAKHKDVEPASKLLDRIRAERRKKWEEAEVAKMRANGKTPKGDAWTAKYKDPAPVDAAGLPELLDGWCWASLDELTAIVGGITKGQKRKGTRALRSVPYLRVANVQRGRLDLGEIKTIEATEDEIAALRLQRGDVLLNEGGDRDKLGRGWVWEDQVPECIHQNHVFRARKIVEALQPKYLSHYTNQLGQAFFVDQGKQTTNLASVSMSRVRRFPIALPPAAEQSAIVEILDRHLAVTSRIIQTLVAAGEHLTTLERGVLAKAFRGELTASNANDGASVHAANPRASKALFERTTAPARSLSGDE